MTNQTRVETRRAPSAPRSNERTAAPETAPAPTAKGDLLDRLLRMADAHRASGAIHNAIEIYFSLVEGYPGTSQAEQARARLVEIGEMYERSADFHQARTIYERFLRLE